MGKKSISVPELQRMLGLKKGAAYWLIKQGHFETIIVGKKMRVMLGVHRNTVYGMIAAGKFKTDRHDDRPRIDKTSFAEWYHGQKRYYIPGLGKEA